MDNEVICKNFGDYYFDNCHNSKIDRDFIDVITEKDQILYKFFIEGKSRKEISQELNIQMKVLCTHIAAKKKQINTLHDIYLKTGCKRELIDEVLKVRFKMKYIDDIVGIYNREIKNPFKYIRFTEHYFPEIMGKLSRVPHKYFDFVDEVIGRKKIFKEYFEKGKMAKDISIAMGKSEVYVTNELYDMKNQVRSWYCSYAKQSTNKIVKRGS